MTPVLKEAKRLYRLGFAIIWLHPKGKRPIESGWTTGDRKPWAYLEATYKDGFNVGVRTGKPSKVSGGYLACIDVDIKDPKYAKAALSKLSELPGVVDMPEVTSGSGGGSKHLYCTTDSPFKMITVAKEEGWEICIYSDGRQMALPPSIHPTGRTYEWEHTFTELPRVSFAGVLTSVNKARKGGVGKTPREASSERSDEGSIPFDFLVSEVDLDWLPISAKILGGITDGLDVVDRSNFLLPAAIALHSAGLNENEILSVLTSPDNFISGCAFDHAQTKDRKRAAEWLWKYTVRKIFAERLGEAVFGKVVDGDVGEQRLTPEQAALQTEELMSEMNWKQNLDRTKQGKLTTSLKNMDLIFSHAVEGNVFVKDLFANRVVYGADTPWGGKGQAALEDIDLILVKRWFADSYGIEPTTSAVLEATSLVGHKCRVHPVREWLESLKWDGVSRADTWIKDYCEGVAEEPYLSQVSRKFLLAMVKRVFEPGCQWDYVLVLEGKQGRYKSSIARALAGDKWFMDNLPDLKDKDAMLNLQGKWLIELGELTSVKRSDYNLVKAYLVRRTDTVRPHYGRIQADVPRQSVFIGTVNEGQYLKDPTGNRRYWPVTVGLCDVKGLSAVRDQLFAEAMHIYRETNEILMLDEEATAQAAEAQDARRVEDDESEMRDALREFLESDTDFNFERFRARELFEGVGAPWGRFADKNYALQTAAMVLSGMGFERHKIEGQRIWRKAGAVEVLSNPNKRGIERFRSAPPSAPVCPGEEMDFL